MSSRLREPSVQDFPPIYPIQEQLRFLGVDQRPARVASDPGRAVHEAREPLPRSSRRVVLDGPRGVRRVMRQPRRIPVLPTPGAVPIAAGLECRGGQRWMRRVTQRARGELLLVEVEARR